MSESRYDPRYDPRAPDEERPRPFSDLPPPPPDVVPSGEVYDWFIRGCDLLDSGDTNAAVQLLDHCAKAEPESRQVREALVELVVAGDEKHRNRPVAKQRQARPGAVDVAGQHQQFGAGGGFGLEQFRLEVQVRQQLQPHHAIRRACFKPPLAPSA